jgi:hypothetical protein
LLGIDSLPAVSSDIFIGSGLWDTFLSYSSFGGDKIVGERFGLSGMTVAAGESYLTASSSM